MVRPIRTCAGTARADRVGYPPWDKKNPTKQEGSGAKTDSFRLSKRRK